MLHNNCNNYNNYYNNDNNNDQDDDNDNDDDNRNVLMRIQMSQCAYKRKRNRKKRE